MVVIPNKSFRILVVMDVCDFYCIFNTFCSNTLTLIQVISFQFYCAGSLTDFGAQKSVKGVEEL